MKLEEAQAISVSGVAVRGNPIMQDIIWPQGSPFPFAWIGKGYVPQTEGRWADKDDWEPLHRPVSAAPSQPAE
ncbi:MAG: hypothetical protein K8T91_20375 [Planctomycetes bacterium]|nr:hypothetical protein [Planctomycetota bacterium]